MRTCLLIFRNGGYSSAIRRANLTIHGRPPQEDYPSVPNKFSLIHHISIRRFFCFVKYLYYLIYYLYEQKNIFYGDVPCGCPAALHHLFHLPAESTGGIRKYIFISQE